MTAPKFDPSALQGQIDNLEKRIENSFSEIKGMLLGFDGRLRTVELKQASDVPLMQIRMDAAWKKIDKHDEAIGKLAENAETALQTARGLERVAKWLLGIFTIILGAILIALVTGKATIIFN